MGKHVSFSKPRDSVSNIRLVDNAPQDQSPPDLYDKDT